MSERLQPRFFPPADSAGADGLLLLGGRLTPDWLIDAYRHGIFPWPILFQGLEVLAWFSPDPRAILEWHDLHISRRLRRRLRQHAFQVTCNQDFRGVVASCAGPRRSEAGTWITPEMRRAYCRLHEKRQAHSIEVWQQQTLVGGIYGVSIGGLFAAESMFSRVTDASKVALAYLVRHLRARGYQLLDVQQATPHTCRLGARTISRTEFLQRLAAVRDLPVTFGDTLEPPDPGW